MHGEAWLVQHKEVLLSLFELHHYFLHSLIALFAEQSPGYLYWRIEHNNQTH